jgi:hypothetical protein
MLLIDKMRAEMTDEEYEFLFPQNPNAIDGYFFEMEYVAPDGNWMGYVVLPDDREVKLWYFNDTGKLKYEKGEAYLQMVRDANKAFPLDSCAIDTLTALLHLASSSDWESWDD